MGVNRILSKINRMSTTDGNARFAHLSDPSPEWLKVADRHAVVEAAANKLYSLPIEEFRKIPYRPAQLAADAPVLGQDLEVAGSHVKVRDGADIGLRVYRPITGVTGGRGRLVYYNIHGGGEF